LNVNDHVYELHGAVGTTLADALRDELSLTGTNGRVRRGPLRALHSARRRHPTLSCITLVHAVDGAKVTTIEGLREHPMVQSFVRADALQCGFCTPGQIVSAVALVDAKRNPSTDEIRHAHERQTCAAAARIQRSRRRFARGATDPAPRRRSKAGTRRSGSSSTRTRSSNGRPAPRDVVGRPATRSTVSNAHWPGGLPPPT